MQFSLSRVMFFYLGTQNVSLVQQTDSHTHIKQRIKFWSVCFNFRLLDLINVSAANTGATEMQLLAHILLLT